MSEYECLCKSICSCQSVPAFHTGSFGRGRLDDEANSTLDAYSCAETVACKCERFPCDCEVSPASPTPVFKESSLSSRHKQKTDWRQENLPPGGAAYKKLVKLVEDCESDRRGEDCRLPPPFVCECDEDQTSSTTRASLIPLQLDVERQQRTSGGVLSRIPSNDKSPKQKARKPPRSRFGRSPSPTQLFGNTRHHRHRRRRSKKDKPTVQVKYEKPVFDPATSSAGKVHIPGRKYKYDNENLKKNVESKTTQSGKRPPEASADKDKLKSDVDREVFDELGIEGLVPEERLFDHEDCVETYGKTILRHFKKEELEREYHIHEKPSLLTGQMKVLIILIEAVIIALVSLFIHWVVVVRKGTFDLFDILDVVSGPNRSEGISTKKLNIHMTIYVVIFVILLPHVIIVSVVFEFVNTNRLTAITFTLKLLSFCLFFGGLFDIEAAVKETDRDSTRDYKTHFCFGQGAVVVFIMYIVVTGVKLTGHVFRRIFDIRILGYVLRAMVRKTLVIIKGSLRKKNIFPVGERLVRGLCRPLDLRRRVHVSLDGNIGLSLYFAERGPLPTDRNRQGRGGGRRRLAHTINRHADRGALLHDPFREFPQALCEKSQGIHNCRRVQKCLLTIQGSVRRRECHGNGTRHAKGHQCQKNVVIW